MDGAEGNEEPEYRLSDPAPDNPEHVCERQDNDSDVNPRDPGSREGIDLRDVVSRPCISGKVGTTKFAHVVGVLPRKPLQFVCLLVEPWLIRAYYNKGLRVT
ncbi:hypothetical protein NDU88_003269 [Pleurodeles waltl]|uniref:Uncharacterized protein n=1 Tax=Pleurodeles waltl TaxID=8319 RepID=A0AAV7UFK1_PLEWA|nr:hypothetical protein NDU88_003269 [Pleurodeles waltl]